MTELLLKDMKKNKNGRKKRDEVSEDAENEEGFLRGPGAASVMQELLPRQLGDVQPALLARHEWMVEQFATSRTLLRAAFASAEENDGCETSNSHLLFSKIDAARDSRRAESFQFNTQTRTAFFPLASACGKSTLRSYGLI